MEKPHQLRDNIKYILKSGYAAKLCRLCRLCSIYPGSSPYNDAKRYFPILNDLIFWRKLGSNSGIDMPGFGNNYVSFDFDRYHLNVFSSTDLLKGSSDKEDADSKIKHIEGQAISPYP